jgi:hypothetical protein
MKLTHSKRERGFALMMVLFFAGLSLMALGGALSWSSSNAKVTARNNEYFNTLGAAEAATEKIATAMSRDYRASGEGMVYNNLSKYATNTPSSAESTWWSGYEFSNAQGTLNRTYVSRTTAWAYSPLQSQYAGLNGMAATYKVVSNARSFAMANPPITVGVRQELQVASIPLFQFAIFYTMDLEINPGPPMNITGRVHSNGTLYTQPQDILNYLDHVTAVGPIVLGKMPGDPSSRNPGTVNFQAEHDGGVSSLSLPIGTNNSPANVRAVVEIPPAGEDPNSLMGQQRYYNKADLIILVSNSGITAKSGGFDNFATSIPSSQVSTFTKTTVSFYNKREGKTVKATEIDVAKLKTWSATNSTLRTPLGRDVSTIYVADSRTQTSSTEPGIRLVNGQTLPPLGLTVATPHPLYIKGNYNVPNNALGTTNTSGTRPASLVADAITILSTAWDDSNAGDDLDSRTAANTTINAAFLAGIVPTGGGNYSGGVENFPRFLEDWGGYVFTYNGSMVVMFYSQYATAPWGGSDVYSPPNRNWAFDSNFKDSTKLPPSTPQLATIIRASWSILPANQL